MELVGKLKNTMQESWDKVSDVLQLKGGTNIENIKATFAEYDHNGDGHISIEELEQAMRKGGAAPSKLEVRLLMAQVDKDGNGVISLDEFVDFMSHPRTKRHQMQELKARFDLFDKDGDGMITRDEMKSVVRELEMGQQFPDNIIEQIFNEADSNKDGKISFEEFSAVMS